MFESVTQKDRGPRQRRWIGFVLGSAAVNALLIVGAYVLVPRDPVSAEATEVAVTFAPKVEASASVESPPPPPPPVRAASASPGGKRLRRALEAPASIPDRPPSVLDPVRPPGSDEAGGEGTGAPGVASIGPAPEPPPATVAPAPARRVVQVNEDMEPPEPDPANPVPTYPESARMAGLEGLVEFRITVDESGAASLVGVQRGEEPFIASALAVLPDWRFRPARMDGAAVAVQQVVRMPFRLYR